MRKEVVGDATLYLGDCLEILPTLSGIDAVITDPPYGIGKDGQTKTTGGHGGRKAYDFLGWDRARPNETAFQTMLSVAPTCVFWGGNYFADMLPPAGKWLVWDKGQRIRQSDGELAYTTLSGALRICTMNRVEIQKDGAVHPTQKPVRLMEWTIQQVGSPSIVCDPYMGSGSTGVACARLGISFIGIEREQSYFDIACRRIEEAYAQPRLVA